jgi:hypothetical protein
MFVHDSMDGKALSRDLAKVLTSEYLIAIFPEMLECHRVTETDSYILKIVVFSIAHLEQVINRLVPYGEPATSIVLSSLVSGEIIKQEAINDALSR